MPAARKATTKHDVSFAEVQRRAQRDRVVYTGLMAALVLAVLSLPLLSLREVVEPLAGKDTNVNFNFVVSATLVASLTLNGVQYLKGRARSGELERQRERLAELERGGGV